MRRSGANAVPESITLGRVRLDRITADELVDIVFARLAAGRGGQIITPNLDILQQCDEHASTAELIAAADLSVADGVPLLWLAQLAGSPLPGRVAGSDLVWSLAERAAKEGRSIFLLGGDEGVAGAARRILESRFPGLAIGGIASPRVSFPPTQGELAEVGRVLAEAAPDLVYCAFGTPKQERLAAELAPSFPRTWFLGCGASLSFIAGHRRRAPVLLQRLGLEWLFRMLEEPGRLARRYLGRNLPYLVLRAAPRALAQRLGHRAAREGNP